MVRRTPPRPVAVEEYLPELGSLRREAVRLHPRPGSPSCHESSVGGPLLWPVEEPWPVCDGEPERGVHEPGTPFVPVVQVRREDAPGIPFPPGCDLLQVLWCPFEHGEWCCPLPLVRWRDSAAVTAVREAPPPPADALEDHVPHPCVVHPERVTEYPSWDIPKNLRDVLRDRMEAMERSSGFLFHYHLADAPGIKLGGYPGWTQDPVWPDCPDCGRRMDHLLTVASREYDGESIRTWLPVEDRREVDGRQRASEEASTGAGMMLGDVGGVYIFECRTCPARPTSHWFDCS
ncbi:DUF1963 domain-containing protein [Streptomyces sp. NPDC049879]|uniref:DUF1963 domain-containing protein n=1 Tax=Streptomyces sp. NPDC049879 TaxID=3365598 RepID=UPI0037A03FC6